MDESAEAALWYRLIVDGEISKSAEARELLREATEIEAIMAASYGTARANLERTET